MQANSNSNNIKHKIWKSALEFSNHKKTSDLSTDILYSSNFSTKLTNTNFCNKKIEKIHLNTPIIINKKDNYNTINEYSEEDFLLSKMNLECDINISSLKKKLNEMRQNRKKVELKVINLRKKINELQNKEKKSLKQLEYTKNYINKIKKKSKNNLNKNYGIIITKINNIYQNNKNPGSIKLNINNSNNYKTWMPSKKKISFNHKPNLSHLAYYSAIKNNSINISNNNLNSKNNLNKKQTIEKIGNYKICSSPISSKIYIKKNITSVRKTKNYRKIKDNLIKHIKRDIDEKLRIEREIDKINKEQNKIYNNFYENFVILRSAKTLDIENNNYDYNFD